MADYNTQKINAYKEIVSDYDAAKKLLNDKHLALGQQAIVYYYYPNDSADDKKVKFVIGIGGLNGYNAYITDYAEKGEE